MQQSYCYLTSLGFLGGEARWKRKKRRKIKERPERKNKETEMPVLDSMRSHGSTTRFLLLLLKGQIEKRLVKREKSGLLQEWKQNRSPPVLDSAGSWRCDKGSVNRPHAFRLQLTLSCQPDGACGSILFIYTTVMNFGCELKEKCSAWVPNIIPKTNAPSDFWKGLLLQFFH